MSGGTYCRPSSLVLTAESVQFLSRQCNADPNTAVMGLLIMQHLAFPVVVDLILLVLLICLLGFFSTVDWSVVHHALLFCSVLFFFTESKLKFSHDFIVFKLWPSSGFEVIFTYFVVYTKPKEIMTYSAQRVT